jgi:hypothetical protein
MGLAALGPQKLLKGAAPERGKSWRTRKRAALEV